MKLVTLIDKPLKSDKDRVRSDSAQIDSTNTQDIDGVHNHEFLCIGMVIKVWEEKSFHESKLNLNDKKSRKYLRTQLCISTFNQLHNASLKSKGK